MQTKRCWFRSNRLVLYRVRSMWRSPALTAKRLLPEGMGRIFARTGRLTTAARCVIRRLSLSDNRRITPSANPPYDLRVKSNLLRRIKLICPVQSPSQKYFCFSEMQISRMIRHPIPKEGRWPTSSTRGGSRWTRMALLTKAPGADGESVWS